MTEVAALPSQAKALNDDEDGDELAKRFDHQCLQMQLTLLQTQCIPDGQSNKLADTARRLEAKHSIPMVAEHLGLLQRIQTPRFWEGITLSCLETVRISLRKLMRFLDKDERSTVYTSFEDELEGEIKEVGMPATSTDLEQYYKKVATFVKENESHITIQRLKRNKPVTQQDLEQLEAMLFNASGIDDKTRYEEVVHKGDSVGVFIRSLVGLDTKAAKEAFGDYLDDTQFNSTQIEFVKTIIEWLCQNGTMEPAALHDPPFINFNDDSVYGLFSGDQAEAILDKLKAVNDAAYPTEKAVS